MKRYFAMLLAVVLLCICTGAVAMGWGRADNSPPPELTPEERIMAAEAQIQAAMADIEKAKKDLSDVQTIKNILGLDENG